MLTSSFLHIPGVGPKTESHIWRKGIVAWGDFLEDRSGLGLPRWRIDRITDYLNECSYCLEKRDIQFFTGCFPRRELWRLYPEFRDEVAFLDIETTGLSPYYDQITLVGLFDGKDFRPYIAGHNLDDFQKDIHKFGLIVTFNGSLFDLPFLRKQFPGLRLPAHIDLRFLLRRLGFSGGLKAVEKQLGIHRPKDVEGLDGFDSTILWNRYIHGNINALSLLIKYNRADVVNLEPLMQMGYVMMQARVFSRCGVQRKATSFSRNNRVHSAVSVRRAGDAKVQLKVDQRKYSMALPKIRKENIGYLLRKLGGVARAPRVVGIDLTGSEKRASGWALLEGKCAETKLIRTDREIIQQTVASAPRIISIDSPLSIPGGNGGRGGKTATPSTELGIMRECERILRRRGIYVFPCLLPSMRSLTMRGIKLSEEFRSLGFEVIESYPGAAQDILGIVRKKIDLGELKQGLADFGIEGGFLNSKNKHDELDAITSALVGYFYLSESYEALGNENEGYLVIPRPYR